MHLSIVAALFRSAAHLPEFIERIRNAAAALVADYEIVLVNDDSDDDSLAVAMSLADRHREIRVLDLSRRYGHYETMLAGLRVAKGEHVFLIDSDLEEPPELLSSLWAALLADREVDFAVACQIVRRRTLFDAGGELFYWILRRYGHLDVPPNNLVARLMTRRYVDALVALRESPVSFDALCARAGFRYVIVPAEKGTDSPTTYSLLRRSTLFVDALLVYTNLAARAFVFAALLVILAGSVAWSLSERAFGYVVICAAGLSCIFAAALCRYAYLVLQEIRYQPARVRQTYPHA